MSVKGNELLTRARQQFRNQRTVETLVPIPVPEWDTTVYFWPAMSVEESAAVGQYLEMRKSANGSGEQVELHLTLGHTLNACMANVLHRARDEGGSLLFDSTHAAAMRGDVDENVILRIGQAMGFTSSTLEDAEKN